ncbi:MULTISPECIES: nucleoid occlusion protein [Halanaerobium]|jgi:ParB family chromosome partitioning protein|uniref:Chromosome partitioning protein, ParB family n=1 Tax=Halanaerobium kushneri TaxID=56779 RepID=A0A1N7BDG3_9FIRM|nr:MULTISPECIES: nucleoid occlusion protein [Halanaerobium]RCW52176.1 ParB family chromosome partitioning protein [Halanaerobium sp. ST460_2HS_T2]SIR49306.1 chromosome partitioning protein, ParB family [Halanaerobium kushneri]
MKIPFFNQENEKNRDQIVEIKTKKIKVNPFQPRQEFNQAEIEELASSIKNFGLIQAITVRKKEDGYELIAGERRLRAARFLNREMIPAVIKDFNDQQMAEIALIENLQRKDLNFLEEAHAYQRLIDQFNLTQKELAARVSKSQSTIANKLRLLNLPSQIREKILTADLSERHGRALLQLDSASEQLAVVEEISSKGLNVREAEKLIKKRKQPKKAKKKIKHISDDLRLFANSLEKRIKEIKDSGITVDYERNDEQDSIEYYIKLSNKK